MSDSVSFTLEEYRLQRQYREQKRKQYLRKFQILKQKVGQPKPSLPVSQPVEHVQKKQVSVSGEEEKLMAENKKLRQELETIEKEEREKLTFFKDEIANVKGKYIEKIKEISEEAKKNRDANEDKMKKIISQIKSVKEKNQQIEGINQELSQETQQAEAMIEKYSVEIRKEYGTKLNDFEEIFRNSNEKIEAMEAEMNEEEFVENTLKNEELMASLKENSEKGGEDIDKIISDYSQLLEGKKQILAEISNNNSMKEKEIEKMSELEGKLKIIIEKLTTEKKIYIEENNKMAQELIQVKELLMASMGQQAK